MQRLQDSLRRVTSSGRYIPAIDGLRFLAVFSVVLYHLNLFLTTKSAAFDHLEARQDLLQRLVGFGNSGVQLFFVISGLVLALPFAEHFLRGGPKVSLRQYFTRRLLRIEPPYLISLAIIFALIAMLKPETVRSLVPNLIASALYLHNAIYDNGSVVHVVAWSLEVEVQFYLIAPLLAWIFAVPSATLRRSILLAAIVAYALLQTAWPGALRAHLPVCVFTYLDFFLAGFLLADVYSGEWKGSPRQSAAWDLPALASWLAVVAVHFHPLARPWLPLAIWAACAASFRGRIVHRCLSAGWVVTFGGMCYTIYLYHFIVISALGRLSLGWAFGSAYWSNYLVQGLVLIPPVFVVCPVLFVLFERPFMFRDWPARFLALLGAKKARRALAPAS